MPPRRRAAEDLPTVEVGSRRPRIASAEVESEEYLESDQSDTEDEDIEEEDLEEDYENEDQHQDEAVNTEEVEFQDSRRRYVVRRDATRSSKTRATYASGVTQYKRWCDAQGYPLESRYQVQPKRVFTFLEQAVYGRASLLPRGQQPRAISVSALANQVSALVDLWNEQRQAEGNSFTTPRDKDVKELLMTYKRETNYRRIVERADRGIGTPLEQLQNPHDAIRILSGHFTSANTSDGLRNNVIMLFSLAAILRGETMRKLELADMFTLDLSYNERTIQALVLCQTQGSSPIYHTYSL